MATSLGLLASSLVMMAEPSSKPTVQQQQVYKIYNPPYVHTHQKKVLNKYIFSPLVYCKCSRLFGLGGRSNISFHFNRVHAPTSLIVTGELTEKRVERIERKLCWIRTHKRRTTLLLSTILGRPLLFRRRLQRLPYIITSILSLYYFVFLGKKHERVERKREFFIILSCPDSSRITHSSEHEGKHFYRSRRLSLSLFSLVLYYGSYFIIIFELGVGDV